LFRSCFHPVMLRTWIEDVSLQIPPLLRTRADEVIE
jgi:hypothetical protein